MTHVLLFDSDCMACSRAARAVAGMGIDGMEVRGLSDPEVLARLGEAGLAPPIGPALLSGEGAEARLATGWAMRRGLARLLGWRRATRVVSLISIEARARASRTSGTLTRRRVLGFGLAAAAGAVVSALLPEAAAAVGLTPGAAAAPDTLGAPTQGQVAAALGSPAVQGAVRHWGPISVLGVANNPSVLMFSFDHVAGMLLAVDNADVLRALPIKQEPAHVRYFTASGVELGTVGIWNGKISIHQAAAKGLNRKKVGQFLACIGAHADAPCLFACEAAVDPHTQQFIRAIYIAQCLACAGPKAVACARRYLA